MCPLVCTLCRSSTQSKMSSDLPQPIPLSISIPNSSSLSSSLSAAHADHHRIITVSESPLQKEEKPPVIHQNLHHSQTTHPPSPAEFTINDGAAVEKYLSDVGLKRTRLPFLKTIVAAIMAGLFICLGGIAAQTLSGGLDPSLRTAQPALSRLLSAVAFPIGLLLIVVYGGDLFTSSILYCTLAYLHRSISLSRFIVHCSLSYFTNFLSCLFFTFFLAYLPGLFDSNPYLSYVTAVAEKKIHLSFSSVFLKAIAANSLVCFAVWMAASSRDFAGRAIAIYIPIATFVACGFEHVIANMYYLPCGLWYGADITWGDIIIRNLIPATMGNIIGGGVLVGVSASLLFPPQLPKRYHHWHQLIKGGVAMIAANCCPSVMSRHNVSNSHRSNYSTLTREISNKPTNKSPSITGMEIE